MAGLILEKPRDKEDAFRMLRRWAGPGDGGAGPGDRGVGPGKGLRNGGVERWREGVGPVREGWCLGREGRVLVMVGPTVSEEELGLGTEGGALVSHRRGLGGESVRIHRGGGASEIRDWWPRMIDSLALRGVSDPCSQCDPADPTLTSQAEWARAQRHHGCGHRPLPQVRSRGPAPRPGSDVVP